jgi:hypothetical protein
MAFVFKAMATEGVFYGGGISAPQKPTSISAVATSDTTATISWTMTTGSDTPVESYSLYRNTALIASGIKALNYLDSGLTAETAYTYYVRGVNSAGSGAASDNVSITTLSANGVEGDAWTAFKAALEANPALSAYKSRFKWNRVSENLNDNQYPLVVGYVERVTEEEFVGMPKRKICTLIVSLHGKVKGSGDNLEHLALKMDELIKNAVESDLQLGGAATIEYLGDSEINYLDDNRAETLIQIQIKTVKFIAGSR